MAHVPIERFHHNHRMQKLLPSSLEKNMITVIERPFKILMLELLPMNNGEIIRLNIPPLTEERRVQLTKQVRAEGEEAKISIRNARRDAIERFKR